MLAALLNFLDRRAWLTWTITLLALLASCWYLPSLQISDAPERWMPRTTLSAWKKFAEHFEAGDTIAVGLHFKRPVMDEDLQRLSRLRQALEQVPGVQQVYDCSLVAEKIEHVPLTTLIDPQAENADLYSLYSGVLWDEPTEGDRSRTLMTVCLMEFEASDFLEENRERLNRRRRETSAHVDEIVRLQRSQGDWQQVDLHVASGIMLMREMEKRTRQVAYRFLPASILVGLVTLLLGFRSFRALVVAVVGSILAMILVLGGMAALGVELGVVTMAAPTLMSVVAIASTVHLVSYAAEVGPTGRPPDRRRFVQWVGVPCLGAAVTTGFGFLMLRFNELEPISNLGTQMFAGSILAFLGVFVVSQLVPIQRAYSGRWMTAGRLHRFFTSISARPRLLVAASLTLTAVLIFFAWPRPKDEPIGLHVDADPFSFFSDDQPIKIALKHFSKEKFAVYQLDVILIPRHPGTPAQGLNLPDEQYRRNLQVAQKLVEQVEPRQDLGVIRILSTQGFQNRYRKFLTEVEEIGSQYGLLPVLARFGRYATSANILNHSFQAWNTDKQGRGAQRITIVAHDSEAGFKPLFEHVQSLLPHDEFECHLAGSIAQNVALADGLGRGMLYGLGTSLLVMGVLCGVLFRSLRLALIAFLPNVFPVLVVFGLMGAVKMPISSGSAMVATIALGIALNDTIHFLLHYRQRTREEGLSVKAAVDETVQALGRPIVLTSLVHLAGFTIFLLTDFVPLYQFGLLSSIAMLAALAGDLVLLPNLLLVFDRQKSRTPLERPTSSERKTAAAEIA